MAGNGGGAFIGMVAAKVVKAKKEDKKALDKKLHRQSTGRYRLAGNRKSPIKLKSKNKNKVNMEGRSAGRKFAARITISSFREAPNAAIDTVIECSEYFKELHFILPMACKASERANNLSKMIDSYIEDVEGEELCSDNDTHASENEVENDNNITACSIADDMFNQLKDKNIDVYIHCNAIDMAKMGSRISHIVDIPSLCNCTVSNFERFLEEGFLRNVNIPAYNNRRYSLSSIFDEDGLSLFTPLLVTILMFQWLRGLFTWRFKTMRRSDIRIYPLVKWTSTPRIPDNPKAFGCFRFGTGIVVNREQRCSLSDGPCIEYPLDWSGWRKFTWTCLHEDDFGIAGIVFGYTSMIWLFSIPVWDYFYPWLSSAIFTKVRVGFYLTQSVLFIILLPRFTYRGGPIAILTPLLLPVAVIPAMCLHFFCTFIYNKVRNTNRHSISVKRTTSPMIKIIETLTIITATFPLILSFVMNDYKPYRLYALVGGVVLFLFGSTVTSQMQHKSRRKTRIRKRVKKRIE